SWTPYIILERGLPLYHKGKKRKINTFIVDLGGPSKSTSGMVKGSKIQSGRILINLASDRSACYPDSNGTNVTQI
ncbi:hypothetical protein, partial [Actinobacillus pleuropneumoniae]|uniref:hypothetical protein n=1 Tax=Actinobacillus pleuropneumoniae TaxID=715 RepID=UPI00227AE4C6